MRKLSKILLLVAGLLLVVSYAMSFMTGVWLNLNSILMGVAAALAVFAAVREWKLVMGFLTMRTTKHGMNMGAMIVLVATLLVCLNYLANRHNKVFDLTEEKQYSLSPQSLDLLKGLKDDMRVTVLYKGQPAQDEKLKIKGMLDFYADNTSRLRVEYVNVYVDQVKAREYLSNQPDVEAASTFTFVEYGGKRIRVEYPYTEAEFTSAMIKATRTGESKVYFVKGHGERELDAEQAPGLKSFVDALTEASFKVEPLSLIDAKGVPADAAVVAIVGPTVGYLDEELKWLREYVDKGGKLFLALDPDKRHNLANLTKSLGVQFENNYVLTRMTVQGEGPLTVLGQKFDAQSNITRSIPPGALALFKLASEVKPAPDAGAGTEVREIVKSNAMSWAVTDPSKPPSAKPEMRPVDLAVEVKGKAAVFGDSDFLSNQFVLGGVNRDLGVNTIASLAGQTDLLSIKPKLPKGTNLVLTTYGRLGLVIFGLGLPLALLISGGVLWFRRRGA